MRARARVAINHPAFVGFAVRVRAKERGEKGGGKNPVIPAHEYLWENTDKSEIRSPVVIIVTCASRVSFRLLCTRELVHSLVGILNTF